MAMTPSAFFHSGDGRRLRLVIYGRPNELDLRLTAGRFRINDLQLLRLPFVQMDPSPRGAAVISLGNGTAPLEILK